MLKFFREFLTERSVKEISLTVRGVKTVRNPLLEVLKRVLECKLLKINGVKVLECFTKFRTVGGRKIANEISLFQLQISNYAIY